MYWPLGRIKMYKYKDIIIKSIICQYYIIISIPISGIVTITREIITIIGPV